MDEMEHAPEPVKAALFVDFDNIFAGLRKVHPKAAEEFATNPARWLAWFERGMPSRDDDGPNSYRRRALLLRHCYLNPGLYSNYRPFFTRSAFKVVDCPSLTQQNKNSTDIHMVMDILDVLKLETRFDEFIILSGDSDFTPVLLRLRLFNRRTVILTPGPVAQSYKAASDRVISEDIFIEDGMRILPEGARKTNAVTPAGTAGLTAAPPAADKLRERILACVKGLVAAAPSEVNMAWAAGEVIKKLGPDVTGTKWAGAGSFKALLLAEQGRGFDVVTPQSGPGYLIDRSRRRPPNTNEPAEDWEGYPEELSAFARRINRVTGAPLLRPDEYALVFKTVEDELRENAYFLSTTTRAVRDRCAELGKAISRRDISFILKGITYAGHEFGENPASETAEVFAGVSKDNVLKLCKGAQLELSDEELKFLDEWLKA